VCAPKRRPANRCRRHRAARARRWPRAPRTSSRVAAPRRGRRGLRSLTLTRDQRTASGQDRARRRRALAVPLNAAASELVAQTPRRGRAQRSSIPRSARASQRLAAVRIVGVAALATRTQNVLPRGERQRRAGAGEGCRNLTRTKAHRTARGQRGERRRRTLTVPPNAATKRIGGADTAAEGGLIAALAMRSQNVIAGERSRRAAASGSLGRLTNARRTRSRSGGCTRHHEISARWPPSGGRTQQPLFQVPPVSGAPPPRSRSAPERHDRIGGADTTARGSNEIAALAMRTQNVIVRGERPRGDRHELREPHERAPESKHEPGGTGPIVAPPAASVRADARPLSPRSNAPRSVGHAHAERHRSRRVAAPCRGQRELQEPDPHHGSQDRCLGGPR